ncbi:SpoIIE family protein phosphatase [Flammeovirgaceae bacterium SG7u.111]|nr:SpoIIE family protein phosphatase [Flammeovirgaceae bacterium SG7u.132]WPO35063.1 SpoIIE family protein phosphatase [Flammeovirgaceae bacterium SG7u.111]
MRFFILLLFLSGAAIAQDKSIGTVIDENGIAIANVKVSVNNTGYSISDEQGSFDYTLPAGSTKPTEIAISATGFEMKIWKFEEEQLKVTVRPVSYLLIGKALDVNGDPIPNAQVLLNESEKVGPVKAKSNGVFSMNIPPNIRVGKETKFLVNRTAIDSDGISFEEKGGILVLQMPIKTFTVVCYNDTSLPAVGLEVTVKGKTYTTDSQGGFKVKLAKPKSYPFTFEEFEIADTYFLESDNHITLYLKKKNSTETPGVASPILEEGGDGSVVVVVAEDTLVAAYADDFNYIINELELEKQQLIQKSNELRTEMEKIVDKLNQEGELTDEQIQELHGQLQRLESALIETDVAYEDAQVKTKAIIDRMNNVILKKDSVNVATQQQVEVITDEKRKVEEKFELGMLIFVVIVLSLASIALIFFITGKKIRKQKNELELVNKELANTTDQLRESITEINAQKSEIQKQAEVLQQLNEDVNLKNKKITDNMRYALTVQKAILPSPISLKNYLKDHFITFFPKDIVSGDFYWFNHLPSQNGHGERAYIAAVDCTGHGVSGAFMSMVGNMMLNEIIDQKKIYEPASILRELNKSVREGLRQEEKVNDDGMDICLCMIERQKDGTTKAVFTGAKRPLILFDAESKEVRVFKGDIKSVGGRQNKNKQFTNNEIILKENDALYLTSDGLVDQNNNSREKFGTKRFLSLLEEVGKLPMEEQRGILEAALKDHQGDTEQRDDILVLGVRV